MLHHPTFLPDLQIARNRIRVYCRTSHHLEKILSLYIYETICFCRMNFHSPIRAQWSKFHFPVFSLPKPKVSICSARCRNNIPQGNCDFLSTKSFQVHKCLSIIAINRLCGGKLETLSYASGPTVGTY